MTLVRIQLWAGAPCDGVLLFSDGATMRVAVRGGDDAVAFHCRGGQWFTEEGQAVTVVPYEALHREDEASAAAAEELIEIAFCPQGEQDPDWLN